MVAWREKCLVKVARATIYHPRTLPIPGFARRYKLALAWARPRYGNYYAQRVWHATRARKTQNDFLFCIVTKSALAFTEPYDMFVLEFLIQYIDPTAPVTYLNNNVNIFWLQKIQRPTTTRRNTLKFDVSTTKYKVWRKNWSAYCFYLYQPSFCASARTILTSASVEHDMI